MSQTQTEQLNAYRKEIDSLRAKIRELSASAEPEPVADYTLSGEEGNVALSSLFDGKDYLFVIHNMGKGCPYCTLWADGFNGVLEHLQNRAAFIMASPDGVAEQQAFKQSRGWKFRMYSHLGTSMSADLGFAGENGHMPGVSVLKKAQDGALQRVSQQNFGPGDDFCAVWHLFDLIPEGAQGWQPKYAY